jgi:hypothetical protein
VVSPASVQHGIPLDLGVEYGIDDVVNQANDESDGHDDDHYCESDYDDGGCDLFQGVLFLFSFGVLREPLRQSWTYSLRLLRCGGCQAG